VSIKIMSAVWDSGKLNGTELLTCLCLADYANDEGVCWPKMALIARRTRQSERNARRMVERLEKLGAVSRRRGKYSNFYRISVAWFMARPDESDRSELAGLKSGAAKSDRADRTYLAGQTGQSSVLQNHHEQPTEPSGKTSCAESSSALLVSPPAPPVAVIEFPLNDGNQYPVIAEDVREWKHLYPAVNVEQELRNMRGWLLANREKRKTRSGIKRFINSWLAKKQDKAGMEGLNASRKGDRRKNGGAYHSGDPSRTYDREPDLVVEVP
jgi:hypothetical protein